MTAAALLSLLLPPPARATYMGPTPCHSSMVMPSVNGKKFPSSLLAGVGYSSFNHLLFDMVSLSTAFLSGHDVAEARLTFRICPGSVIDLDDSTLPLGVLPIRVPGVTLQCGKDGRRGTMPRGGDGCVLRGGGRRDPRAAAWNVDPRGAYRAGAAGVVASAGRRTTTTGDGRWIGGDGGRRGRRTIATSFSW